MLHPSTRNHPSLLCPTHISQSQTLVHVCMNPLCCERPLLCVSCLKQSHSTHTTISLTKFLEEIDSARYDTTVEDAIGALKAALKENKVVVLRAVEQIKEDIEREFGRIEEVLVRQIGEAEEGIGRAVGRYGETIPQPIEMTGDLASVMVNVGERHRKYFTNKRIKEELVGKLNSEKMNVVGNREKMCEQIAVLQKQIQEGLGKLTQFVQMKCGKVNLETEQAVLNTKETYKETQKTNYSETKEKYEFLEEYQAPNVSAGIKPVKTSKYAIAEEKVVSSSQGPYAKTLDQLQLKMTAHQEKLRQSMKEQQEKMMQQGPKIKSKKKESQTTKSQEYSEPPNKYSQEFKELKIQDAMSAPIPYGQQQSPYISGQAYSHSQPFYPNQNYAQGPVPGPGHPGYYPMPQDFKSSCTSYASKQTYGYEPNNPHQYPHYSPPEAQGFQQNQGYGYYPQQQTYKPQQNQNPNEYKPDING